MGAQSGGRGVKGEGQKRVGDVGAFYSSDTEQSAV